MQDESALMFTLSIPDISSDKIVVESQADFSEMIQFVLAL